MFTEMSPDRFFEIVLTDVGRLQLVVNNVYGLSIVLSLGFAVLFGIASFIFFKRVSNDSLEIESSAYFLKIKLFIDRSMLFFLAILSPICFFMAVFRIHYHLRVNPYSSISLFFITCSDGVILVDDFIYILFSALVAIIIINNVIIYIKARRSKSRP